MPPFDGVRKLSGELLERLARRTPPLPRSQSRPASTLALDPLQNVLSHYPEARRADALERARLLQADRPLQYLEDGPNEGRWFDQGGLTSYEIPLLTYSGDRLPGSQDVVGLFRHAEMPNSPLPRASVQLASSAGPGVLQEESLHAIDRLLPTGRQASYTMDAPSAFAWLLENNSPQTARSLMRYFGDPSEIRATLSGLLPRTGPINNAAEATGLLESVRDLPEWASGQVGTQREMATAEAILRSKPLRNEMIPYLLKALGVGGAMAGTEFEDQ